MHKYKRIINGECHFQMIELFDDVEKAANNSNRGEFVECNIQNLKMDFAKVVKEKKLVKLLEIIQLGIKEEHKNKQFHI